MYLGEIGFSLQSKRICYYLPMPLTSPRTRLKPRKGSVAASSNGRRPEHQLVIVTGMSGSGKGSVLKAFEDLGYYSVDNLPIDLLPRFAELILNSRAIERAALVIDVREGSQLERLPAIVKEVKKRLNTQLVFLEANDDALVRRFSETRRPHPLGKEHGVPTAITAERRRLVPIRNIADMAIDTSKFNVHELRAHILNTFQPGKGERTMLVACTSFGFRNGVPPDADLVFDVRFLPNPHFIPKFRPLNGTDRRLAKYIGSFPQTQEFLRRVSGLLKFLLPHYIKEGKSYLTIAIGCTGGQHRSVFIAEELGRLLAESGYKTKVTHRDVD